MNQQSETLHKELPKRREIEEYLSLIFFNANKDTSFHITEIAADVAQFFDIPNEAVLLKLKDVDRTGHLNTGTLIESLTHFAVFALARDGQVKRTGPNQWQHIHGPSAAYQSPHRVSVKKVREAMVSVKMLKDLNHTPEEIICEICHLWEDEVAETAIEKVFA